MHLHSASAASEGVEMTADAVCRSYELVVTSRARGASRGVYKLRRGAAERAGRQLYVVVAFGGRATPPEILCESRGVLDEEGAAVLYRGPTPPPRSVYLLSNQES
eukprot:m51a1_g13792 hypothetical protein (105) ;mRNA; f:342163-342477